MNFQKKISYELNKELIGKVFKGIIIGHKGQALKKVGAMARKDIERFFEKKVFLEMFVKVEKDWRNRDNMLRAFGYRLE